VIEQASDIGVVESFCGGSISISCRDYRIGHEGLNQSLQILVLKSGDEVGESSPQLINVFRRFWKIVSKLDFRITQFSKLMNRELETLFVLIDEAFDFQEIILLKRLEDFLYVVPHFGFNLTAAIAECEREVRLPSLLGLDLFGDNDKSGSDDLIFVARTIANVEVLHQMSEYMTSGPESFSTTASVSPAGR
jgi:hypothetical protein